MVEQFLRGQGGETLELTHESVDFATARVDGGLSSAGGAQHFGLEAGDLRFECLDITIQAGDIGRRLLMVRERTKLFRLVMRLDVVFVTRNASTNRKDFMARIFGERCRS